jgi:hypothetical protein
MYWLFRNNCSSNQHRKSIFLRFLPSNFHLLALENVPTANHTWPRIYQIDQSRFSALAIQLSTTKLVTWWSYKPKLTIINQEQLQVNATKTFVFRRDSTECKSKSRNVSSHHIFVYETHIKNLFINGWSIKTYATNPQNRIKYPLSVNYEIFLLPHLRTYHTPSAPTQTGDPNL